MSRENWTSHDYEMERIGQAQARDVYERRLAQLEAAGWGRFLAPFYYEGREYHSGFFVPSTRRRVPVDVAFSLFCEANPDVVLEPYRPHPQGWAPPPSSDSPLFHIGRVTVEPMPLPSLTMLFHAWDYTADSSTSPQDDD